ncbi:MAG: beta-hydroxyacyl-ACP dehydratase [Planctomycetes bacterium]|nr:beta-hydroxyacyl-ACP dehydratase [Planctomycetota bacterium]MCH8211080.1 beta-hydroxyacyl-ACP dehydratase [Planctomycetota bacterium]
MAASPLFDLAKLDLTQVAVSSQRVGEINPHAGHMRQLDHVIWLTDDFRNAVGVKHVRDDEFWVPGHVPGRPLFPGVLMIEAAAQLCSLTQRLRPDIHADMFIGFTRCDDVVFRGQVVPGDTLYLLAKLLSHRPRRFTSAAQGIVNGSLVFEATITGMVM